jgi:hypothetical protein
MCLYICIYSRKHGSTCVHAYAYIYVHTSFIKLLNEKLYNFYSSPNIIMEQRPKWEARIHSSSQETPRLLWNPKVRYCTNSSQRWTSSWTRRAQPISSNAVSLRHILILLSYLRLGCLTCLFPSCFSEKKHDFITYPSVLLVQSIASYFILSSY